MSVAYQTLRDRQIGDTRSFAIRACSKTDDALASIERILNLNHAPIHEDGPLNETATNGLTTKSAPILDAEGEPIWKVLIFDDLGRDVISSVLRVSDLRTWGVTIHLYVPRLSCEIEGLVLIMHY